MQEAEVFDDTSLAIYGHVKDIYIPDVTHNIFSNPIFLDKLKEFQVDLLLNKNVDTEIQDFEQDNIQYKLLVNAAKNSNGETIYFYTMASLQPVNEAVQMIKEYYIYCSICCSVSFVSCFLLFKRNRKTFITYK
ncbi:hypothetical protein [Gracilibacillus saliphilus]|uniref:hypothetical protein n=1 Tax=Gracilibacillus saliphilus TaxID=543890 RepID=UPI003B52F1FF